ncbi:MAG: glycosyltransferase family 2 protein [Vicinamibacteria bacterium]
MRPSLAVVLITRDAAHLLERTLTAVSWADSILVVDAGSADGTREFAEKLGARVVLQPVWKGYCHQKSFALSLTEGDWILVLDADEVVDPTLAQEIRRVTATRGEVSGYSMRRVNFFGSDRVRYGHSRPSYVDRLFQKGKGRISEHRVHERVLIDGPVERLKGELCHYTSESIAHRIRKNDEYAAVAAEDWSRQGRRARLVQLLFVGPLSLLRDLVLKGGILEGKTGVVLATLGAFYSFSKQAKLWELERRPVARREPYD